PYFLAGSAAGGGAGVGADCCVGVVAGAMLVEARLLVSYQAIAMMMMATMMATTQSPEALKPRCEKSLRGELSVSPGRPYSVGRLRPLSAASRSERLVISASFRRVGS